MGLKSKLVGGFSIPKATDSSPTSLPKNCLKFDIRLNAIAMEYTPEERKSGNSTDEVCIVTNNDDDDDDDNDKNDDIIIRSIIRCYFLDTITTFNPCSCHQYRNRSEKTIQRTTTTTTTTIGKNKK